MKIKSRKIKITELLPANDFDRQQMKKLRLREGIYPYIGVGSEGWFVIELDGELVNLEVSKIKYEFV